MFLFLQIGFKRMIPQYLFYSHLINRYNLVIR